MARAHNRRAVSKMTRRVPIIHTAVEALAQLSNLPRSSSVHFLVACPETRTELMQLLVEQETHRMRDLWQVDGVAEIPDVGTDRFELHKLVSEQAKSAPYTMVVDFGSWTPDAIDNLFHFLSWANRNKQTREWKGLTILAMGPSLPWYIDNVEQQCHGITVKL